MRDQRTEEIKKHIGQVSGKGIRMSSGGPLGSFEYFQAEFLFNIDT